MKKDIIIISAGGFGREILWLLQELNNQRTQWNIKGFVDDDVRLQNTKVNGYSVLGTVDWLVQYPDEISVVCCIAKPKLREYVISKLQSNSKIEFPNIIADGVKFSDSVQFGKGNIICLGSALTIDIKIGDFNIINLSCTIGHDVEINNYVTLYPGVNISGKVSIGNYSEIGTGSQVIQGLDICDDTVIGAGSVVIRSIIKKGTYVGVPVREV